MHVRAIADASEMTALYDLRERVLRPGRPPEAVRYQGDEAPTTLHLGAFTPDSRLAGIASLFATGDSLQLRGMAVEPNVQRRGVGALLVRKAQQHAFEANKDLWCNARASACGFYEKLGWTIEGNVFELEGIGPHYIMRCKRSAP